MHAPCHTPPPYIPPCHTHPLPCMPPFTTHTRLTMHTPCHVCPLPHMPPLLWMPPLPCTSPLDRMTDACENIIFPQLLLRAVIKNSRHIYPMMHSRSIWYGIAWLGIHHLQYPSSPLWGLGFKHRSGSGESVGSCHLPSVNIYVTHIKDISRLQLDAVFCGKHGIKAKNSSERYELLSSSSNSYWCHMKSKGLRVKTVEFF